MSVRELDRPLRGIIVPMVTPLTAPDQLDEAGVERLVEHMIAGGVHGLFLLGTCGEGPSLSHGLQRQFVDRVCAQVDGRIPVLVSIADTSMAESVSMAAHAAEAGADAVVLAPPYYYPVSQDDLAGYVERLVQQLPLPLVLYNMPGLTKMSYEPATIRRLMNVDGIVGMKDSSGDLNYFQTARELMRDRPDWTLLVGPEHLLARTLELGGDGGVSGGANVWPQVFVQIYEATIASTDTAIAELTDVRSHLVDQADRLGRIYQLGPRSAASVIKGLKGSLSVLGICDDLTAEPLTRCTPAEKKLLEGILQSLGIAAASVAN